MNSYTVQRDRKKALVLLSGCGVYDGSEIHESTLLLLALDREKIDYQCIAPPIQQSLVINHLTHTRVEEQRNALIESARIARGNIIDLESFLRQGAIDQYDVLVIPGGFGAASTLCNYAQNPEDLQIEPLVEELLTIWLSHLKPCLATCISPVLLAAVGKKMGFKLTLTLGENPEDRDWLNEQGMSGILTSSDSYCIDHQYRIITTPAYMNSCTIKTVWQGIEESVNILTRLCVEEDKKRSRNMEL